MTHRDLWKKNVKTQNGIMDCENGKCSSSSFFFFSGHVGKLGNLVKTALFCTAIHITNAAAVQCRVLAVISQHLPVHFDDFILATKDSKVVLSLLLRG